VTPHMMSQQNESRLSWNQEIIWIVQTFNCILASFDEPLTSYFESSLKMTSLKNNLFAHVITLNPNLTHVEPFKSFT
jgi:hypothetical protein